ncbi:odorant receptor 4-like [Wyeomyia smithii]|uniref:odorant receptor 4-like n=1 Tax=Wyeomyia smithii TaxID=174621 RepID=UPI002467C84A|nr:odorant receptor 4-like [Wyeomyia smithii]
MLRVLMFARQISPAPTMSPPLKFDSTFEFTVKVQKTIGIRCLFEPYPTSLRDKLSMNAGFITTFMMLSYCVLGQVTNVILLLNGHRETQEAVEELATQIVCTTFCITGLVKMYGLAYHRNTLANIIEEFRTMWDEQLLTLADRQLCDKVFRPTMSITAFAAIGNIVMVSAFNFLPVAEMLFNKWQTDAWKRFQPYVIWFPFDSTTGWWYYLVYTFEAYSGYIVAVSNVGTNCIFCLLCAHLTMQLQLLNRSLEIMMEPKEKEEVFGRNDAKRNLCKLVQWHQKLLRAKETMDSVFSVTFFLNFSASTVLICVQAFLMLIADFYVVTKMALFMGCCLVEIFFLCYYGDEVLEFSTRLAQAVYNCRWYQIQADDARFGRNLIPIIQRAQRPMKLMAWKFWPITINSFALILNASWSYFTLLRTFVK